MGIGPPRLEKYSRLLSRLFEFLALFHILKRIDGPHVVTSQVPTDFQGTRRRFLKSLSFVCDYRKGGDTTTSIALESRQGGVVFWIAANLTPNDDVLAFLSEILGDLRRGLNATEIDREALKDSLTRRSVQFAAPRLRKECGLLVRAARSCENYLIANIETIQTAGEIDVVRMKRDTTNGRIGVITLLNWLSQFSYANRADPFALCQAAYNARHDPQMTTLQALNQELSVAPQGTAEPFRTVRHFVGRLAERVRVPANLVHDSHFLRSLLNSYEIRRVEAPNAAKAPISDNLRNLDSIIKRMLPAGDSRLEDIQSYIERLDGPMKLEDAIRAQYDDEGKPQNVHAEIQMLEEFHRNKRIFVEHDRYIACSKLACLCCKFYFRFHPGRFVEPESHQKTYLTWRPIDLPGLGEDEHWTDQRRVLGMLSAELRTAVEEHIVTQQQPTPWQPDSATNITTTMNSLNLVEVEEMFESGDGASDAHLNEDDSDGEFGDSEDESDGGAGLED
ncbi:hypothetical protein NW762_009473 [Fusarium torreyae]|uniref:Uncharacterized protein n=1 Tax=Fusarium torreyae TaxID=1237075 RepID=A0A9W8RX14_9HYPO|nr:hypothetical protein NW762_009473 [Fusarium torreyae]